jgi:hypothetical protein
MFSLRKFGAWGARVGINFIGNKPVKFTVVSSQSIYPIKIQHIPVSIYADE